MAKNAIMTFRTHYALALWNINIRKELEKQTPIKAAVTGEKAARRLFSLYISLGENNKNSPTKRVLAAKLLNKFEDDIVTVKTDLLAIKKRIRQTIKDNTKGNLIIENSVDYKMGTAPTKVNVNADLTAQVASYVRLYLIFDEIVELTYKKRSIGLISYDQYRAEIAEYSKGIKVLMNSIINTTKEFFNIE